METFFNAIKKHIVQVTEKNLTNSGVKLYEEDLFRLISLNKIDACTIEFKIYEETFFNLSFTYIGSYEPSDDKSEFTYTLSVNPFKIGNRLYENLDLKDSYRYSALMVIGYISKSLYLKQNFYPFYKDLISQYMNKSIDEMSENIMGYIDMFRKEYKGDFSIFEKPKFIIYSTTKTEIKHEYRVGKDNAVNTTHISTYHIEFNPIDSINSVRKGEIVAYVNSLGGKTDTRDYYYSPLGEDETHTSTGVNISLTRTLLELNKNELINYKEIDWKEINKHSVKLTIEKIHLILFILFCDGVKRIKEAQDTFNLFARFSFILYIHDMLDCGNCKINAFSNPPRRYNNNSLKDFKNPDSCFSEYAESYVYNHFDKEELEPIVDNLILNVSEIDNIEIVGLFKEYFNQIHR